MPSGSTTFHEDEGRLTPRTRDLHRAIVSLMEELEAIDWYQQRMDATCSCPRSGTTRTWHRRPRAAIRRRDSCAGRCAVHRATSLRQPGVVFSTRGGDFVMTLGGDLAVGYRQHDRDAVHLMCVETVAGQTASPQALCLLVE